MRFKILLEFVVKKKFSAWQIFHTQKDKDKEKEKERINASDKENKITINKKTEGVLGRIFLNLVSKFLLNLILII
jgi:hypothetical protein